MPIEKKKLATILGYLGLIPFFYLHSSFLFLILITMLWMCIYSTQI